ncbi:acetyl-CoA hydrolase/transferase C-terminal domain-containing protein [Roseivivax sp. THAF30]|uniref:acetyl-CoA hydrolase/transferase C-terminal domain-containing protein n=1 Tax=Roseivivax sp. THAF30 TaxID=2587852 RepID=UPI001C12B339|nr:acetyl-CoA hydrolase/transferase C-terminal domain-containing protein [Roseivivax sp. THAF30]
MRSPTHFDDVEAAAREIVARLGNEIRVGLPLGLGKPVTLINALTRIAKDDPSIRLSIFTALTLERPNPSSDMERRFLEPAMDRLFGRYPGLDYAAMLRDGTLPDNINVREFFFPAGRWLGVAPAQQDYVSVNYSDARDVLLAQKPNLILHLVAWSEDRLSVSCNPDITADLMELRRDGRLDALFAGETNPELPFMEGAAAFPISEADILFEPKVPFELFSAVKQPVDDAAKAIGLHVSRLIVDGGTLQIGIGAIGDAVAQALILRDAGKISAIHAARPFPGDGFAEETPFETGLYAVTEMLVDGLLQLFKAGIIRREVDGAAIHAGFFVESRDFYSQLRNMNPKMRSKIAMSPISYTNTLFGDEPGKRAARTEARFVNSAMKVTLLGAAISDTRPDGQVVSGVGGQHDFAAQAHALLDGRSIITLPSTRQGSSGIESNIVWSQANETIPRHMRDIVVTEYGIADLWGKSDAEAIASLIEIADSRFQSRLLKEAKAAGKVPASHEVDPDRRNNTPQAISGWLNAFREEDFPDFPFGSDFDEIEREILPALRRLKAAASSRRALFRLAMRGWARRADHASILDRMGLSDPRSPQSLFKAAILVGALEPGDPHNASNMRKR